jgi:hypothetical protein
MLVSLVLTVFFAGAASAAAPVEPAASSAGCVQGQLHV